MKFLTLHFLIFYYYKLHIFCIIKRIEKLYDSFISTNHQDLPHSYYTEFKINIWYAEELMELEINFRSYFIQ